MENVKIEDERGQQRVTVTLQYRYSQVSEVLLAVIRELEKEIIKLEYHRD